VKGATTQGTGGAIGVCGERSPAAARMIHINTRSLRLVKVVSQAAPLGDVISRTVKCDNGLSCEKRSRSLKSQGQGDS
jgi:hypothetical protein